MADPQDVPFLANLPDREPDEQQLALSIPGLDQDAMERGWPACQEAVLNCFPDMCPEHLMKLAVEFGWNHERVIGHVLDQQDTGQPYPKWEKLAKRKWQDVSPEEESPLEDKIKYEKDQERLNGKDAVFLRVYTRAA